MAERAQQGQSLAAAAIHLHQQQILRSFVSINATKSDILYKKSVKALMETSSNEGLVAHRKDFQEEMDFATPTIDID